jgi:hypothetical protein
MTMAQSGKLGNKPATTLPTAGLRTEKHLVRPRLVGLTDEYEYDRMAEANRAQVDEFLSGHLPVHRIDITPNEMKEAGVSPYERDNMNEIGDYLLVAPPLVRSLGQRILKRPETGLEALLSEIGYKKKVARADQALYDNGRFVIGQSFGLVSSRTRFDNKLRKELGLTVPVYQVHQVSTLFFPGMYHDYGDHIVVDMNTNGHIDCRFNIVDQARIIYMAMGARPGTMKEGPNPLKEESFERLKEAAKEQGYELRDFFIEEEKIDEKIRDPEVLSAGEKFGPDLVGGHAINGINFITDGDRLFTSVIGYREKEYLESKGMTVVEVPLKFTYNGAGLRCLYGELTTGA